MLHHSLQVNRLVPLFKGLLLVNDHRILKPSKSHDRLKSAIAIPVLTQTDRPTQLSALLLVSHCNYEVVWSSEIAPFLKYIHMNSRDGARADDNHCLKSSEVNPPPHATEHNSPHSLGGSPAPPTILLWSHLQNSICTLLGSQMFSYLCLEPQLEKEGKTPAIPAHI